MSENLHLSPFQERVLALPDTWDVFLGGGRGGGKSYALALLALRLVEQYGARARILYLRQTFKGVADFEALTRELFGEIYGTSARYNATEHVWRFPNGAYLELGQLADVGDYQKYQGRSFILLMIDEGGQYADPALLDRLRSNLRGPRGIPIRMVIAANPGDPGHYWLSQRYVFRDSPWVPFHEPASDRQWVYAPSTYRQNPFIEQDEYRGQLRASCPSDPELLRAWLDGDWAIARGAFFGSVIEESRNAIDPWDPTFLNYRPRTNLIFRGQRANRTGWDFFLAYDHGSSAPAVCYVVARSEGATSPDGRFYPRGSLVLVDEMATHEPDRLSAGMGYVVPQLADEIKTLAKKWAMPPTGCADDACFSNHGSSAGSIANEFRDHGVSFRPAGKGSRLAGWEVMRRLLFDAGKPDVPGLYVSRSCGYWWATVPFLGRDPRKSDDVDSKGLDHGADATRYGCIFGGVGRATTGPRPW